MITYELNYGNKATINTGDYCNESPMFNEKLIITVNDGIEIDLAKEFEKMKVLVDTQLHKAVAEIRNRGKQKTLDGLRIKEIDGVKYPSVTTVLSPTPPEIPNLELYGLRGNMWDRVFQRIVEEARYSTDWTEAELKQIEVIGGMKGHSLQWIFDNLKDIDFRAGHTEVINTKDIYYGTYDADGFYKGELALFDCKSGKISKPMIDKSFMQIAAYCKAKEELPKYMVIIPTQQAEPIVSEEIDKYYQQFLQLRQNFRNTYGC